MSRSDSAAMRPPAQLGLRDPSTGRVIAIRDGLQVGRAFPDVPVADQPSVSRRQGEFRIAAGVIAFAQNEVLSPAKINGADIAPGGATVLRAGDRLRFGEREFEVVGIGLEPALASVSDAQSDPASVGASGAGAFGQESSFIGPSGSGSSHGAGLAQPTAPGGSPVLSAAERERGGALVWISAVASGAFAAWRAVAFAELAPPAEPYRLYVVAAAVALAGLGVAWAAWSGSTLRRGASPAAPALAFVALAFGLQWALFDWIDVATGFFSKAQADGFVRACAGDSFRSGPCAELYDSCGPRCRSYALPRLSDALVDERSKPPLAPAPAVVLPAAPPAVSPEAVAPTEAESPSARSSEPPRSGAASAERARPAGSEPKAPIGAAVERSGAVRAPASARPPVQAPRGSAKDRGAGNASERRPSSGPVRLPSKLPQKRAQPSAFPEPPKGDVVQAPRRANERKPARDAGR